MLTTVVQPMEKARLTTFAPGALLLRHQNENHWSNVGPAIQVTTVCHWALQCYNSRACEGESLLFMNRDWWPALNFSLVAPLASLKVSQSSFHWNDFHDPSTVFFPDHCWSKVILGSLSCLLTLLITLVFTQLHTRSKTPFCVLLSRKYKTSHTGLLTMWIICFLFEKYGWYVVEQASKIIPGFPKARFSKLSLSWSDFQASLCCDLWEQSVSLESWAAFNKNLTLCL